MQLLKTAELFNMARNFKNTSYLMPSTMSSKSLLVWVVLFFLGYKDYTRRKSCQKKKTVNVPYGFVHNNIMF